MQRCGPLDGRINCLCLPTAPSTRSASRWAKLERARVDYQIRATTLSTLIINCLNSLNCELQEEEAGEEEQAGWGMGYNVATGVSTSEGTIDRFYHNAI